MIHKKIQDVTAADEGAARLLVRRLTGLSHSMVQGLFDHGCVRRAGDTCRESATLLVEGETLELCYDPEQRYRPKPRPKSSGAFRSVFEDPYLIVVDKAPGVLTVPNHGEPDTLLGAVRAHLGRGRRNLPDMFIVHRLDRDTSGLLVIARTEEVAQSLKGQFAAHKPERVYSAIVAGRLPQDSGSFRSRLVTDSALNQRSTSEPNAGKLAITHYRVTGRISGATAVEVRLETGRRNQIRVHFSEAGHPVLGDVRYTPEQARHQRWRARRLALHAAVLGFRHPLSNEALRFESPAPPEFAQMFGGDDPTVRQRRRGGQKEKQRKRR